MLDFRATEQGKDFITGLKKLNYEDWHIVRHGRGKELTEAINSINWKNGILFQDVIVNNKTRNVMRANGATKGVMVFDKIVIKGLLPKEIRFFGLGNQIEAEVEFYQKILHNGEGEEKFLCPILKYYQREQLSIMPKCEHVGSLKELIEETGIDPQPYKDFLRKYNLQDCWSNRGNAGIFNGIPVLIDYAL